MDTSPLNPFDVYARAYRLDRSLLASDFHVLPARMSSWLSTQTPPKTACKLLALRVAQRRGRYLDSVPDTLPRRMGVFQLCTTFNITPQALAKLLSRNPLHIKRKHRLSKLSDYYGKQPVFGDTLAPHEVWYVEILHHLVTKHHVTPPKGNPWPGGQWHLSQGNWWWIFEGEDAPTVMRTRPADHTES